MDGSASEGQESAAKRVFVEPPLNFCLLESMLEVGGSELEDARFGPVGQQVEQVAEVAPRLEAVKLAAGDERDESGVGRGTSRSRCSFWYSSSLASASTNDAAAARSLTPNECRIADELSSSDRRSVTPAAASANVRKLVDAGSLRRCSWREAQRLGASTASLTKT